RTLYPVSDGRHRLRTSTSGATGSRPIRVRLARVLSFNRFNVHPTPTPHYARMHLFSSLARLAALGLVALLPTAHAQLSLSGSTRGEFTGSDSFFTWINNGPVTSTLDTGIPLLIFPNTSIEFTGDTFSGIGQGDSFDLGRVKIKNGITPF